MSYARFGESSNVYVYAHYRGFIECCGCSLSDTWDYHSRQAIVDHMQEHVTAGHMVPAYLLEIDTYNESDFTPMCEAFMCRKEGGHDGGHSPHRLNNWFPWRDYHCPCGSASDDPIHKVSS